MGTRLALVVAVILGFTAALGVRAWMNQSHTNTVKKYDPVQILVAKNRLKEGTKISGKADHVPKKFVVAGMIPYSERGLYTNKVLNRAVGEGEPIFKSFLEQPEDSIVQESALVGKGKRTVTIRVDQISGVAGMLKPGDYVDIIGTFQVPEAGGGQAGARGTLRATRTFYLLQAAKIVALDNQTLGMTVRSGKTRSQNYRTVTFEVEPGEDMTLLNAQDQGTIHLVLRSSGDVQITEGFDEKKRVPTSYVDVMDVLKNKPSAIAP